MITRLRLEGGMSTSSYRNGARLKLPFFLIDEGACECEAANAARRQCHGNWGYSSLAPIDFRGNMGDVPIWVWAMYNIGSAGTAEEWPSGRWRRS